ncbi:MAG: thioredoxin family protein [Actinomycetales bacterium]|nr:thioredoxin family protein [Actinomycetales bacterium]
MDPVTVLLVLVGLVVASTCVGALTRRGTGRVRVGRGTAEHAHGDLAHAERAELTLLQFSSEFCAPCRATARVLGDLAAGDPARVRHVEVDIAERPELVREHRILQTPTTLLVDRDGAVRGRIGGAVRRDAIAAEVARLLESAPAPSVATTPIGASA